MNFFRALLNPEQEELEQGDKALISQAANILQVGEFQLLQLAYHAWFGRDLPEPLVSRLFTNHMLRDEVPHWARHYARLIMMREHHGVLHCDDPTYHRYDHGYALQMPKGVKAFIAASGLVAFTLAAALLAASVFTTESTSLLPPYFSADELCEGASDSTESSKAGHSAPAC